MIWPIMRLIIDWVRGAYLNEPENKVLVHSQQTVFPVSIPSRL